MLFDGVFIYSMVYELIEIFVSGWILKIYQFYENEVVLVICVKGKNYKLLLLVYFSYVCI